MSTMQVRITETTNYPSAEVPVDKPPVSSVSLSSAGTASASEDSLSNSGNSGSQGSSYKHLSTKTNTAERLSKAADKSTRKNRAQELEPLKEKYESFCTRFKPFMVALKSYHASTVELEKNRLEVMTQVELFTKDTPLEDMAGKINPIVSANPQSWAKTVANREKTYCAMGQQLNALGATYAKDLEEDCIEYLREWETVVKTRIKSSLAKVDELQKTVKHYERKVTKLEGTNAKLVDKGKSPAERSKNKLSRNQEKLAVAVEDYDKYATTVCHLIDSALDCAWRDMTPLMYRLACMEQDRMGGKDSAAISKALSELVDKLKGFSEVHKISGL